MTLFAVFVPKCLFFVSLDGGETFYIVDFSSHKTYRDSVFIILQVHHQLVISQEAQLQNLHQNNSERRDLNDSILDDRPSLIPVSLPASDHR